ncbi:MAG TPA: hypothetical protein VMG10_32770 [Gemmataceae bacterium]|nr:hypothetical protein [Gemmataceae bacterium]
MATGRSGTPIQVYLPPGMKEQLVEVARKNMRKISAEVVIALQAHLEANGRAYHSAPEAAPPSPVKKDADVSKPVEKKRARKEK